MSVKEATMGYLSLFIAAVLILPAGQAASAAQKKIKSDDLSNMIIQGDNRLRVGATSPEPAWTPNIYKEVSMAMGGESLLLGLRSPAINEPPVSFSKSLASSKTATPWLSSILDVPVLSLRPKPSKDARKQEWVFLVKNYEGNEIYRVKKQGVLPNVIEWEGFDSSGKPLMVGYDYTYSLSMIDEAGNPQHHPGEPFRVDAFRFTAGGKQTVALATTALFKTESETKLSPGGLNLLIEVKDALRTKSDSKVEVVVYDDDVKFGLSRAQVISAYLIKELEASPSSVVSKAAPTKDGQGYRHVNIISK